MARADVSPIRACIAPRITVADFTSSRAQTEDSSPREVTEDSREDSREATKRSCFL